VAVQALVATVAAQAAGVLPVGGAGGDAGAGAAGAPEMAALGGSTVAGGGVTVSEAVVDAVAKIRENIVLRRAGKLSVPGGVVATYSHNITSPGVGTIGVVVGLTAADGTPLPPAARLPAAAFARKIAMHVAAARPVYVARSCVPADVLEAERAVLREQAAKSGKSADMVAKMVEGRLNKFYGEVVVGDQEFMLGDTRQPVSKALAEASKAIGTPLKVAAFLRFTVGEDSTPAPAAAAAPAS